MEAQYECVFPFHPRRARVKPQRNVRWEVEKNLSRLASNWRDRVAKGINELTRQAEQQALDELAALEQTLVQSKSNESQLRDAIADLELARGRLQSSDPLP
jgi:hypothetical protein